MSTWRLLIDSPGDGSRNMAVDEVLLRSASQLDVATIRLYGWSRPTLSLGYFQYHEDRYEHHASQHCDVVRRRSGGGAIVHDHELTYSIALPVSQQPKGSSPRLYRIVHSAIIRALVRWGIHAQILGGRYHRDRNPPFLCFRRRSPEDVVFRGCKIAGSAQRRWKNAVLQHGSVLLEESRCAPGIPGVTEISSRAIPADELSLALSSELTQVLGNSWINQELTDSENGVVRRLSATRYGATSWNQRR